MKTITKKDSLELWGSQGFMHGWEVPHSGYDRNYSNDIFNFIKEELGDDNSKTTLEVGSGAGFWTRYLVEHSKSVTCLEAIEKPDHITYPVEWIVGEDGQYDCRQFKDATFDFVFSFGVFCHFNLAENETYLRDIYRVMKPDATAILMYADTIKPNPHRDMADVFPFNSLDATERMANEQGFKCKNLLEFRDTLLLLKKNF